MSSWKEIPLLEKYGMESLKKYLTHSESTPTCYMVKLTSALSMMPGDPEINKPPPPPTKHSPTLTNADMFRHGFKRDPKLSC